MRDILTDLNIAGKVFKSRLMVGTGKFSSPSVMQESIRKSGTEIVTVALRRVDMNNPQDDILNHIDQNIQLLPNTSGAKDAEEAVRLARISKAAGGGCWVKLEVTPDPYHLLPDPMETFKAAEILVKDGFNVLPYINADPVLAKRLEEIGCVTVMPLAAPIGTNKGLTTKDAIAIIIDRAKIPVVVDAGLGAPSHAALAIEMGADAVLINTAIAVSDNPPLMAEAFKLAVCGAVSARRAGLAPINSHASPSSPMTDFLRKLS